MCERYGGGLYVSSPNELCQHCIVSLCNWALAYGNVLEIGRLMTIQKYSWMPRVTGSAPLTTTNGQNTENRNQSGELANQKALKRGNVIITEEPVETEEPKPSRRRKWRCF